jgi:phosphatidylglycerol---prolipoprotein diacylglyceryl transferase
MMPVLFRFDSIDLAVRGWHTAIALAATVCLLFGPRLVERLEGLPSTRRVLAWIGAGAFVGGRLHSMIVHWSGFAVAPIRIIEPWYAGVLAPGAFVGMVLCAPFACRAYGIPFGRFTDSLVPTIGVGIAIARVGCVLQGCCFGTPCDFRWCVHLPEAGQAAVHPLPIYYALAALVVAAVAGAAYRSRVFEGEVAVLALGSYVAVSTVFEASFARSNQLVWIYVTMTMITAASWAVLRAFARPTAPVRRAMALGAPTYPGD